MHERTAAANPDGLLGGLFSPTECCVNPPQAIRSIPAWLKLDRFGIHVIASQNNQGEIILGDSHEYGVDSEPFDKALINDLMLRELRKVLRFPDWTISQHWHGVYAKHSTLPAFEANAAPGIHICTGTGGAGMTMCERCMMTFCRCRRRF